MAKVRTQVARDGSIIIIKGDIKSYTPPAGYTQDKFNPCVFRPPGMGVVRGPNTTTPPPNSLAARGLIPGRKNFIGNLPENKGKSLFQLMEETSTVKDTPTQAPTMPKRDIHETRDLNAERKALRDVHRRENSESEATSSISQTSRSRKEEMDTNRLPDGSTIPTIEEEIREKIGQRSGEGYKPPASTTGTSKRSDHDMLK